MSRHGVFLIRATHGCDVEVDGKPLGMQASWSDANDIAKLIASRREPDLQGYGRNYNNNHPLITVKIQDPLDDD